MKKCVLLIFCVVQNCGHKVFLWLVVAETPALPFHMEEISKSKDEQRAKVILAAKILNLRKMSSDCVLSSKHRIIEGSKC
jgi:hypothetical protein